MRVRAGLVAGLAGALLLAGCSDPDDADPPVDGPGLAAAIDTDAVIADLEQLQRVADENGGNRAVGTPGYDASVDYVVGQLEDAGFDVATPEFDVEEFTARTQTLAYSGRDVPVEALTYSPATPPGGLTARLVPAPADDTPGCEATDYDGTDVAGAVVLVDRGSCPFAQKQQVAADLGAAAVLVANNTDEALGGGTLGGTDEARIPTGGVGKADGAALRQGGDVTLTLDTTVEKTRSRNVIAQTKTGDADNVVMVGAHLDSVPDGPGINDDGSGVASVLETARQLGAAPNVTNAVRFAFWGAEEVGLNGSEAYVGSLDDAARSEIALYLNFDMVGSPNAGYFVYDGDNSDNVGEGPGPEGSAGIERTFGAILLQSGVTPGGTDFDGRSDYGPFIAVGIPAGGLFTGAEDRKTPVQAEQWGGEPDAPLDPNYHTPQDTVANLDRAALALNARAIGHGVGHYAQSVEGVNGVPPAGDARSAARADVGK
ncbi:M20/M25/M40 family metallo-hydrolase [Rhodococcus sp. SGAir0479]|uniref:M20/M25/M40 family metallo-hydrolase n=1 Tax=Rhodococcus sp. SGAir0479 TaxID=2567884 RepID=UPI0010CD5AF2|nr:M20/M25/M40 family metallo-hydrolase [Rhodococcus sp. SGAir0479]QCQ92437.1 M20/M25/M40 family metallo-hydrolase [Rhodococcus sp. SGAir0479]